MPPGRPTRFSAEEDAHLRILIDRGLNTHEMSRMMFREFGKEFSPRTCQTRRDILNRKEE